MYTEDQDARLTKDGTRAMKVDLENQKQLQTLLPQLDQYDWDKEYNIGGKKGTIELVIWIIIQHADNNLARQKECMDKYGHKLTINHKAYLQDRININTKLPQIYATQGYGIGSIRYFRPIANIDIHGKHLYYTDKGHKYIELDEEEIQYLDQIRNNANIWKPITQYYNENNENNPNSVKVKMLVDHYTFIQ